jgi:hypothetical protein
MPQNSVSAARVQIDTGALCARAFDALLVRVYEAGKLQYVAKVKNGYVPRVRETVLGKLRPLVQESCPFANLLKLRSHLPHSSFVGLREQKGAGASRSKIARSLAEKGPNKLRE